MMSSQTTGCSASPVTKGTRAGARILTYRVGRDFQYSLLASSGKSRSPFTPGERELAQPFWSVIWQFVKCLNMDRCCSIASFLESTPRESSDEGITHKEGTVRHWVPKSRDSRCVQAVGRGAAPAACEKWVAV